MIEAGTRMVTHFLGARRQRHLGHARLGISKNSRTRCCPFDAACSSLVLRLAEHACSSVRWWPCLGDFGRTPKINANDGGRDHWNYCSA